MRFLTNKEEWFRFFKFSVVGVSGTIVDFGVMNLTIALLNFPLILAQALSFMAAVSNNFLWNRVWIYPDSRSKKAQKQFLQFGLVSIIGILIRTPIITWLNRIILTFLNNSSMTLPLDNFVISRNLALAITIAIILFWNFFSNRYWTFGDVPVGAKNYSSTKSNPTTNEH